FAAGQKACQGGHLPDLAIDPLGGFGNAETHIGANIEDHHLDGADIPLDMRKEFDHLLLAAGIATEGVGGAALGLDAADQRLELVRLAAGDTEAEAFPGKAPGNGTAGGVTGANDYRYGC